MSQRRQHSTPDEQSRGYEEELAPAQAVSPRLRKNKSEQTINLKPAPAAPHQHQVVHQPKRAHHSAKDRPAGSAMPQVTLDPSSIDFISKIINDKIVKELTSRDRRILEQVKEMVNESVSQISPQSCPPHIQHSRSGEDYPADHASDVDSLSDKQRRSADGKRHGPASKIPRIRLPKLAVGPQESSSARSASSKGQQPGRANAQGAAVISLPPLGNKKAVEMGKKVQDKVSEDGVQYSQCRSVVYPSATDLDLARQRNITGIVAQPKLSLKHVLGYDGDPNRHGNAVTGKNVLFLGSDHIAYPAAAVVIVLDLSTASQAFFMGHSDDVICLCAHPNQTCIASAQIGAESNVLLLWDYSGLVHSQRSVSKANYELVIPSNTRGVTNISFSGDGEYLLACGLEDTKCVYIFDWKKEVLLASAKTGHVDVNKFLFNSFSFEPFQDEQRTNEMKYASGIKAKDAPLTLPGCYTFVSFGGKQIKFWTLKQEIQYSGNSAANGADVRDYRGKKFRENTLKHVLEGGLGGNLKKAHNAPEYTCCTFIKGDERCSSQIYMGSASGSIYIWQQVGEEGLDSDEGLLSWVPRGRLVLVIAEAHETPLVDLDYFMHPQGPLLVSSDNSGQCNLWSVQHAQKANGKINRMPLEHKGGVQLDESYSRSLCFNETGAAVIIGTANNSVVLLSLASASSGESLDLSKLVTSHNGKVRKVAPHPTVSDIFASICSDKTIRIWEGSQGRHLCSVALDFSPTALSFAADGNSLAVGSDSGMLVVLVSNAFNELMQMIHSSGKNDDCLDDFMQCNWEVTESKLVNSSTSGVKKVPKKSEVNEIRFSPTGEVLAVGCKDNLIHLLSCAAGYRNIGACRGHSSQVRNLDFSEDGSVLRSADASKELLYWDVESCQRITQPNAYRNHQWKSHSCIYGWGLQGIFNRVDGDKAAPTDSEINCVCRSQDGRIVVAAGSNILRSAIKAFDYPALASSQPTQCGGHSSPVLDLAFIEGTQGTRLVSAGGNDSCLFLWDVTV